MGLGIAVGPWGRGNRKNKGKSEGAGAPQGMGEPRLGEPQGLEELRV